MQVLSDEKRYVPAIQGLNAFATSAGGVDAVADLESGQGVDPETFAGLYAGQALAEVAEHLGRDAEGHLTYKNKIVRIYSRDAFTGVVRFARGVRAGRRDGGDQAHCRTTKKENDAAPEKSKDE